MRAGRDPRIRPENASARQCVAAGAAGHVSERLRLGPCEKARTCLAAARLLALESTEAIWSSHISGQEINLAQRAECAAATTYAYNVSVEVAEFAFRATGGAGVYRDQRLQRCFRDIQTGSQHIVPGDESWERVGQVMLGVGTPAMI